MDFPPIRYLFTAKLYLKEQIAFSFLFHIKNCINLLKDTKKLCKFKSPTQLSQLGREFCDSLALNMFSCIESAELQQVNEEELFKESLEVKIAFIEYLYGQLLNSEWHKVWCFKTVLCSIPDYLKLTAKVRDLSMRPKSILHKLYAFDWMKTENLPFHLQSIRQNLVDCNLLLEKLKDEPNQWKLLEDKLLFILQEIRELRKDTPVQQHAFHVSDISPNYDDFQDMEEFNDYGENDKYSAPISFSDYSTPTRSPEPFNYKDFILELKSKIVHSQSSASSSP